MRIAGVMIGAPSEGESRAHANTGAELSRNQCLAASCNRYSLRAPVPAVAARGSSLWESNDVSPTADEVRQQLARILASPMFGSSSRLSRFLRFVVEQTLAGGG